MSVTTAAAGVTEELQRFISSSGGLGDVHGDAITASEPSLGHLLAFAPTPTSAINGLLGDTAEPTVMTISDVDGKNLL